MWAMTRNGVSVEYFDSCESCRYVYLDFVWDNVGSAMMWCGGGFEERDRVTR